MDPELNRWLQGSRVVSWVDTAFWVVVIVSLIVLDFVIRGFEAVAWFVMRRWEVIRERRSE